MALSNNRNTADKGFEVIPHFIHLPVADNVHIFAGSLVGKDSAGRVRPMTAAATTAICVGRAEEEVDNTLAGHTAGGKSVRIKCGVFPFDNAGANPVTNASRFQPCYAVDDCTVSSDSAGATRAIAGVVIDVPASGSPDYGQVLVMVYPAGLSGSDATTLAATLASVANGAGAATIGIEDSAALLVGATVEAALAELAKYQPIALADPGTGQAIPVTRSAGVSLTVGAGAETNTLAIPTFLGQRLIISLDTVGGGTRAITCAQAINQANNTVMTFAQARDVVVLSAIKVGGALRWQVTANDGVALS